MKKLARYLQPSIWSLPTYLGLLTFALILLYLSYQIQQLALAIKIQSNQPVAHLDKPMGKLHLSKNQVGNAGDSLTFTAEAQAKQGKVEYVRYYLLNPTLGVKNDWGGPNWCSCGRVCSASDECTLKTWDLGESGDAARNFAIVWGPATTSGISTQLPRSLNPINVPPGEYDIYIQVKDTAGNINEAADNAKITVSGGGTNVYGAQTPAVLIITNCGKQEVGSAYSFAWEDETYGTQHFYQLDHGAWDAVTGNSLILDAESGEHSFAIQSTDGENPTAVARCQFTAR